MKKTIIIEAIALLFFILFLYTAVSKIIDYHRFVFQMRLAPLPILKVIAPTIGWLVPVVELFISIILITRKYRQLAFYFSVALLSVFELYILFMLIFNTELPCTCGGIISQMSWKAHVVFNAIFITLGVIGLRELRHIRNIEFLNSKKNFSREKEVTPLPETNGQI